MENLTATIQTLILTYGLNIVWAVVILIVGRWVAGLLSNLVRKALGRTDTNPTLVRFISSLIYYVVLIVAVIAAFERLG